MGSSGLDAGSLRRGAADPHFLGAVVDFLLANEALLTQFCEAEAVEPRSIHLASHQLGG